MDRSRHQPKKAELTRNLNQEASLPGCGVAYSVAQNSWEPVGRCLVGKQGSTVSGESLTPLVAAAKADRGLEDAELGHALAVEAQGKQAQLF